MKKMIKGFLFYFLMFLILCMLNTASFVWLVYNFLPSEQVPDLSLWDIGILKSQLNLAPSEYLSVPEKGTIYFFMVIGVIFSIFFVKWLFMDTINRVREKAREKVKSAKDWKKFMKESNNES